MPFSPDRKAWAAMFAILCLVLVLFDWWWRGFGAAATTAFLLAGGFAVGFVVARSMR